MERSGQVQILSPIYNEGDNVVTLYNRLLSEGVQFDHLTFVYDLPNDTSLPFLEELAARDARVVASQNQLGRGVLNALRWGFQNSAEGPVIVVMGDNSDKLSIIPDAVKLWREGATVVSPSRYMVGGKQHGGPLLKGVMSRCAGVSLRLLGFPTSDPTNNFKLYDGAWLRTQQIESQGGFEVALELTYRAFIGGHRIAQLPTEWWDRTQGESRFRLWQWLPRYLKWYFKAIGALIRKCALSPNILLPL